MFGLGFGEIIFIFFVIILLFGPQKLPQIARSIGEMLFQLKKQIDSWRQDMPAMGLDLSQEKSQQSSQQTQSSKVVPMFKSVLQTVQAQDVMTKHVITVKVNEDFSAVSEKMSLHDIRHLPVVDDGGHLVGLITQRDLYKIHSPRRLEDGSWFYDKDSLNGFLLSKVMLRDVITVKRETPLVNIVQLMIQRKIGCLLVVDNDNIPQGIVTRDDILGFMLRA